MTRNKVFLLFVPVALALALLLGVNWTIRPAQASGPEGQTAAVLPNSLAQAPRLERVTVPAAAEQPNAPQAACSYPDFPGLVVYFPLDESAGATSFFDVVNDPPLTGTCTGTGCPTQTTGRIKGAFTFDGIDDGITVPYDAVTDWSQTDDFSLEVWVNFDTACDPTRKVFLGKYSSSNNSAWWVGCETETANQNKAAFNLRSSAVISGTVEKDAMTIVGGPELNDGKWHLVVAVHDAISTTEVVTDTNYLYVDGIQVAKEEHNYLDNFFSDASLNIGWYNAGAGGYRFKGILDEVGIYNEVLSPAQILDHYNSGVGQSYCNDAPIAVDDASDTLLKTNENTPLTIQVNTLKGNDSDPDGDSFSLTAGGGTAQGGTVTGSGPWTYTPKANFGGVDTFTYTATDVHGATDTATVTVTVTSVNDNPLVTNPGPQSSSEGQVIDLQITASDPDAGQVLTYSALNLPPGLSINTSTGQITGTISYEAAALSPYKVKVTVTDNYSTPASAFVEFDWTVSNTNRAPQVTNPGSKTSQVGASVTLQIQATDLDGDDLTFSATGLPDGLSINPTSGLISGTVAVSAKASNTVKVTVTDGSTPTMVEFTWLIEGEIPVENPKVYLPLILRAFNQTD